MLLGGPDGSPLCPRLGSQAPRLSPPSPAQPHTHKKSARLLSFLVLEESIVRSILPPPLRTCRCEHLPLGRSADDGRLALANHGRQDNTKKGRPGQVQGQPGPPAAATPTSQHADGAGRQAGTRCDGRQAPRRAAGTSTPRCQPRRTGFLRRPRQAGASSSGRPPRTGPRSRRSSSRSAASHGR